MDIDAFFLAQDKRMNEPEDDVDEFLARRAKARNPPELYHMSLDMTEDNTPSDSVPAQSHREIPSNDSLQLISARPDKSISGLLAPPSSSRDARESAEDESMNPASPIPTRTSPRTHATTPKRTSPPPSIPHMSPDDNSAILKRKESPTKPDKPARKKAAIDSRIAPFSPIEVSP